MKPKKCKECKKLFTPTRQLQPTCTNTDCMYQYSMKHLSKKKQLKQKRINKEKREFNRNDVKVLKELAQKIFNQYIRLRDKDLPCISCGTTNDIQYHAGHFKPAGGFSYLRFNEDNVHKQCVRCNSNLAGNLIAYREALIEKIGIEKVEILEQPNQVKRWSKEELQDIITIYRKKIKQFQ